MSTPYWLTEEFCREHGRKGPAQLTEEFPDTKGWNSRRQRMRQTFPDLVPALDKMSRMESAVADAPETPGGIDLVALERLLKSGGCTLVGLADHFDCAPSRVQSALDVLKSEHKLVTETAGGLMLADTVQPAVETFRIDTAQFAEEEFCFGVTADNHVGSKYERLDVLEDLADRWQSYGASRVLVAGNWIDGSGRKFNQHDIYVHGVEEQVGNYLAKLPQRPGLEWDVLSGDDHEGWFVQDCHVNIGHVLESEARLRGREDVHDLGYMERDIELAQPGGSAILRVAHAGGGTAYAISYTAQKYVESLQGGEKPKVAILGHYHKYDTGYPREVHTIQPGCTQDQTPFMRKRKIPAHVGGVCLWIRQNELGIITSLKVEWMPYYDREFYAYQWRKPDAA